MIAALPMYDRAELRQETDAFWQAIRRELGHGPEALTRDRDPWDIWQDPDLLLAQTCGLPYRSRLHGQVHLVGTPDFGLEDCPPGYYRSVLVARRDGAETLRDLAGKRIAINDLQSQSGHAALRTHLAAAGIAMGETVLSGAHRASARMVAEGRADLAALDAQSWRLMQRHDAFAAELRVLDHTAPTPGLPYITARARDVAALQTALSRAIAGLPDTLRQALGLRGLVAIPAAAYLAVPTPDACA